MQALTFWKKRRLADDAASAWPPAGEGAAAADDCVGRGRCLARSGLRGSPAPRTLPRHGVAARKDGGPGGARGLAMAEAAPGARRRSGEEEISLSMALRSAAVWLDEDLICSGVGPGERGPCYGRKDSSYLGIRVVWAGSTSQHGPRLVHELKWIHEAHHSTA
jgi:hypothetical protein